MPKEMRGRAFAFNQMVTFAVVPIVAFIAYMLVPTTVLGMDGWRWVVIIGAIGAIFVWFIRLASAGMPALAAQPGAHRGGRGCYRDDRGRRARRPRRRSCRRRRRMTSTGWKSSATSSEIWQPPYRSRTIMLMVFQFFQTFGFYGFAAWVPTLIAEQTGHQRRSQPALCVHHRDRQPVRPADRDELRRQVRAQMADCRRRGRHRRIRRAVRHAEAPIPLLIVFGVLITLSNNILSYSFHAYQSELFPDAGACARGRLHLLVQPYQHGLRRPLSSASSSAGGGTGAVFGLIAFAMLMVVISIGVFGPRTRDLQLEQISH